MKLAVVVNGTTDSHNAKFASCVDDSSAKLMELVPKAERIKTNDNKIFPRFFK